MSWCMHKECSASIPYEMYTWGKCKRERSNKVITYLESFVLSIRQVDMNSLSFYIFFSRFLKESRSSLRGWNCFYFSSFFYISFLFYHFLDSRNLDVDLIRFITPGFSSIDFVIWATVPIRWLTVVCQHLCDLRTTALFNVWPSSD